MFTRDDYMQNRCTHQQFYGQLVEGSNAKEIILSHFTIDVLKDMYQKDEYLNWIPPHKVIHSRNIFSTTWDVLAGSLQGVNWRKFGDYPSIAGRTCVLKAAAKMLISK